MTLQESIIYFLDDYAKTHHQKSVLLKKHALEQWLCFQTQTQDNGWQRVTQKSLQSYVNWRLRENFTPPFDKLSKLSISTLRTEISALRVFLSWALDQQLISHNPSKLLILPKKNKSLPKVVEYEQLHNLFTHTPENELEIRDLAMIELFYSSGLRLAELEALNIHALNLGEQEVRVISGKFNKDRILPIGTSAVTALQNWLNLREHHLDASNLKEEAVFLSRNGTRLGSRQIAKRIKRWAQKCGLSVNLHPHLLRHCMATHLLESSHDIRSVQELLGHSDISSTQIYTHLDFQALANAYDQTHPRAHKKKS